MNLLTFFSLYGGPIELLRRGVHKFWNIFFRTIFRFQNHSDQRDMLILAATNLTSEDRHELDVRKHYYLPESKPINVVEKSTVDLSTALSLKPIMVFGQRGKFVDWLAHNRPRTFDVDFRINPIDGWEWINVMNCFSTEINDFSAVRRRLGERITTLRREAKSKCYLFGTGPSLEKAINHKWNDGYSIVCNTIVRDPILWDYLKPDFIVAGDAIYHYGHTEFARAFRRDLRARLEGSNTLFLYPAQFHAVVIREFSGLEEQLIPIPYGWKRKVNVDLTQSFKLPNHGNVLGLLLLPLACTLSKHVYLWGFDGRAANDKLFWKNSNKHTYMEYMDELKMAHPRFFEHYVPASDPNKYTRDTQGERLELALQIAEKVGWTFEMMHPSWTPTLQRRYHGGSQDDL